MPDKSRTSRDTFADRLDRLLADLHAAYARLDAIADARARAVSAADTARITRAITDENEIVQRLAALDAERASIVRDAAQQTSAPAALDPVRTTITDLVGLIENGFAHGRDARATITNGGVGPNSGTGVSPVQGALLEAAAALRRLIERVQAKNAATRIAAEKLAKHMQGLIRAAEGWHSHSGAYSRSGVVRAGATVVTALDCVS